MAEVSALCQKGMHQVRDWGVSRKGCYGWARDTKDGRYFEHHCKCDCHKFAPDQPPQEVE